MTEANWMESCRTRGKPWRLRDSFQQRTLGQNRRKETMSALTLDTLLQKKQKKHSRRSSNNLRKNNSKSWTWTCGDTIWPERKHGDSTDNLNLYHVLLQPLTSDLDLLQDCCISQPGCDKVFLPGHWNEKTNKKLAVTTYKTAAPTDYQYHADLWPDLLQNCSMSARGSNNRILERLIRWWQPIHTRCRDAKGCESNRWRVTTVNSHDKSTGTCDQKKQNKKPVGFDLKLWPTAWQEDLRVLNSTYWNDKHC